MSDEKKPEPVNVNTPELRAAIRRNNEKWFRRQIIEVLKKGPPSR